MNFAVLCDLNSINISFHTFAKALAQLDGKVSYCKFYSYNNKRNNDFTEYIRRISADIAVPLSNRKKVRLDIRQALDSVIIACNNKNIDAFFLVCSPLDTPILISTLKSLGKKVVLGVAGECELTSYCDDYIILDRMAGLDIVGEQNIAPTTPNKAKVFDSQILNIPTSTIDESPTFAPPINNDNIDNFYLLDNDLDADFDYDFKILDDMYAVNSIPQSNLPNNNEIIMCSSDQYEQNEPLPQDTPIVEPNIPQDLSLEQNYDNNNAYADKFLPYTDIDGEEEEMRAIKDELFGLIKEKALRKSQMAKEQKAIDIDNLIKKYF